MILFCISMIFLLLINSYELNAQKLLTEQKTLQLWRPSLLYNFVPLNTCYTFKSTIGTCLTEQDCRSRNGTVFGFCLNLLTICCELNSNKVDSSLKTNTNSQCITNSNTTGICLEQNDCTHRSGIPDGSCGSKAITCCLLRSDCGKRITQNETEFVNNLYPNVTYDPNVCQVVIERQPNVCQLRLGLSF
jgi:hypothetical protein